MNESGQEWIGVSDLMAGLMMVFLFIAVLFMTKIEREQQAIEEIARTYTDYEQELNKALWEEFRNDLTKWNAEILSDNTVRFKGPEVLFATGSSELTLRFQEILKDFFPRYINLLANKHFKDNIEEVRIEGHTSSVWVGAKTLEDRYLKNADLSQARSFSVLQYCFALPPIGSHREWLTRNLRANGLAFAKLIMKDSLEDGEQSRRVEFRVKTKVKEKIKKIIEAVEKNT